MQALVRQVELHVQDREGALEPRAIPTIATTDDAAVLQDGRERALALVAQQVGDVRRGLGPPRRGLVRQDPRERQLLHVLHRALQQQPVPVLRQEGRLVAHGVPQGQRQAFVHNGGELVTDHRLQLWQAFLADDARRHAVRGVKLVVQLEHLLVQVHATLLGIVPQHLVVTDGNVERVLRICAHVHDADVAPPRHGVTSLELRVHRVDLAVGAVPGQQRLREEAREAVQRAFQAFWLHLEHIVGHVTGGVRVRHPAILLNVL
mmetsp:Transcript_17031/g.45567  ORF Transcript_17031/g.45567 Transcript_17031/m.45567 type:complete len:262 (+) Transcript_17031:2021-2806(+)